MKVIIAPDSFKGSLASSEVADAIEKGIWAVDSNTKIIKIPLADGGEGTVEALVNFSKGEIVSVNVSDPLGNPIKAYYGLLKIGDSQDSSVPQIRTAVIEMAKASGLPLVPIEKRTPLNTTTFGTGELIKDALNKGCKKIIIGIGGSATVDGGSGMAQALGVMFYKIRENYKNSGTDECRQSPNFLEIKDKMTGGLLADVEKIDISKLDERIKNCEIIVACDVDNPLLGEKGAARVYGPQKGATPEQVKILENNLKKFARIIKNTLDIDIINLPGSGAAGGLGGGLVAFLNARLESGIKLILDTIHFEEIIKDADLIITGEGRIDSQSAHGKVVAGVAKIAKKHNNPVIAIGGSIEENLTELYNIGVTSIFSIINEPMELEKVIERSKELIEYLARRIFSLIKGIKNNE